MNAEHLSSSRCEESGSDNGFFQSEELDLVDSDLEVKEQPKTEGDDDVDEDIKREDEGDLWEQGYITDGHAGSDGDNKNLQVQSYDGGGI